MYKFLVAKETKCSSYTQNPTTESHSQMFNSSSYQLKFTYILSSYQFQHLKWSFPLQVSNHTSYAYFICGMFFIPHNQVAL
jgi:hypothetical protein